MKPKILVIEDDKTMREGIATVLKLQGYAIHAAEDGHSGAQMFREIRPDLVISDMKLPGKGGMNLLQEFQDQAPDIPFILISAFGTIDLAVNALKLGARDFIAKPFSIDELKSKVAHIFEDHNPRKAETKTTTDSFHGLVGISEQMQKLIAQIKQIAAVDSPVLITGESGTGKELIARALHLESPRASKQIVSINCSALTDTLLESELFGHEKGAFTGAVRQHQGIFEQAHGGTILLDEIGDISAQLQVKLLRVLQDQSFQRVGGTDQIDVDVRVLAATNRNLQIAMEKKLFREDLFFRLNVLPLTIPALRERPEDIPGLVSHFVELKCNRLKRDVPEIGIRTMTKLCEYSWPGNIRELENFLERLLIFSEGPTITPDQIYFENVPRKTEKSGGKLNDVMEQTERELIRDALNWAGGIKQKAARKLGLKTSTLYYKMEKYDLFDEFGGKNGHSGEDL
ncbi:MAG: sigma-54-dependent Fis family transcriptional regulator [Candidatus Marinimicrobia bacterium]|nr:sigma-54-dependent Fis family transcriptional regulator [Candidatus Neomarinimicrobiota bacterium]MBT3577029.1 sigma-54-dependent Fis family transcriptional regulator [Candidatus Neomarinimicrobiota bacterium]MBT3679911.1 sigma-54-dependent Fis family transcriptional regulator [Candidatus Neomarinimicrobiota bacterium]MBT3949694.1 sigma-54-dependent Fis family transcriptional regulator [Candidatus Neomarinimicrobiota bacterium]MBT4253155.1 sigma-54-dependent Fis family transcriptional regula